MDLVFESCSLYECNAVLERCVDVQRIQDWHLPDVWKLDLEHLSEKNLMVATLAVGYTESSSSSAGHGYQAWRNIQNRVT